MRQWTPVSPMDCLHYAEYRCVRICVHCIFDRLFSLSRFALNLHFSVVHIYFDFTIHSTLYWYCKTHSHSMHFKSGYVPICNRNFCIIVCFVDLGVLLSLCHCCCCCYYYRILSTLHCIISTHCCYWCFYIIFSI